jgi:hypothetical protein
MDIAARILPSSRHLFPEQSGREGRTRWAAFCLAMQVQRLTMVDRVATE